MVKQEVEEVYKIVLEDNTEIITPSTQKSVVIDKGDTFVSELQEHDKLVDDKNNIKLIKSIEKLESDTELYDLVFSDTDYNIYFVGENSIAVFETRHKLK